MQVPAGVWAELWGGSEILHPSELQTTSKQKIQSLLQRPAPNRFNIALKEKKKKSTVE